MSLGLGLTICLSGQPAIAAPAAPPTEARAAFEAGAKAYAAGDFDKALAQFERAMALRPSPKIHYNIGVCRQQLMLAARERGDVAAESLHAAAAVEAYKAYLRELPEAEDRVEVEATIRDLGGTPHSAQSDPIPAGRRDTCRTRGCGDVTRTCPRAAARACPRSGTRGPAGSRCGRARLDVAAVAIGRGNAVVPRSRGCDLRT
ncbi:hypothetical protein OV079_14355 [Nannocystis pusilla]|uniref:Tetratricopeptide repeat protein n=1 Tax=Nannocystis pusilla TaxID=889268 RepID=A0A9X3EMG2_9BACT|nr:hypothetical protein [Nannocystis pusilla]MCY1006712.1 hypothetical protein [Nannocystis pusilla]